MRAEQIGFTQRREYCEKRLRAAHFFAKILESVRQGVAYGKAERAQAERVQEDRHLVTNSNGAVLQVAIIKAEARIENYFFDAMARGALDLAREIITHFLDRI